jgi:hypothetical protein
MQPCPFFSVDAQNAKRKLLELFEFADDCKPYCCCTTKLDADIKENEDRSHAGRPEPVESASAS